MKLVKMVSFLLLAVCFSCKDKKEKDAVVCLPNHLENGVIAFYSFGNGSLQDRSIYNNHLSNTNASPTEDRNGNAACAYQFDNEGSNSQFLSRTNPVFLNGLSSFSVSLWYKNMPTDRFINYRGEGLLNRGEPSSEEMFCDRIGQWSLGLHDLRRPVFGHNRTAWAIQATPSDWGTTNSSFSESPVWHHVVGIKNNNIYRLYYDAVLQQTSTDDGGNNSCGAVQDLGNLFIGKKYTGKIDDILVYNRGLSAAEVIALYQLPACCE